MAGESSKHIAGHAIVLGAGMGGLAATAAASTFFERVSLLERDTLPEAPAQRSGAPQGRHVHGLLMGGQNALEELLPGFSAKLAKAGAVPVRTDEFVAEVPGFDPFPRRDFGWANYFMSRPLIEFTLRKVVSQLDNVQIRNRSRVLELSSKTNGAGSMMVRFERNDGKDETLDADLVIDASGRAVPTLAFLKSVGLPLPDETVIGVDFAYGSAVFEVPPHASRDWKVVQSLPELPHTTRGGLLAPLEGKRWILSVGGRYNDPPPAEADKYLDYLQGLRTKTIYNAVKDAKQIGEIARFAFDASIWRRFDRLEDFPRGLIPFSDSICRFNPVYGQGMSVAAQEALLIRRLLAARRNARDPLAGFGKEFLSAVPALIEPAWQMSAIPDLANPETRGERPPNLGEILKFGAAFAKLAARDPEVHKLDMQVRQLMKPPSALGEPALVGRVMAIMAETVPDARKETLNA